MNKNTPCAVCGASPCYLQCPTQDPYYNDRALEAAVDEMNASYDDARERFAGTLLTAETECDHYDED